jgi:hypothetical protein
MVNGSIKKSTIQSEIEIFRGNTLEITLGNFGDEEGAGIYLNPRHAGISKIYRQLNSNSIVYQYTPNNDFVGKDSVGLILYRGSDGASAGRKDTTIICFVVR